MRSSLLASLCVIELQTTEAYSSFDLINVKYNTHKELGKRREKLQSEQDPATRLDIEKMHTQHDYGSAV
jgi:hypothetical protein